MENTILFAPQVRTIQPAFVHNQASFNFYFSLSDYNKPEDIDKIGLKVIDPNKSSLYGQNVIFTQEQSMQSAVRVGTEYQISFINMSSYWKLAVEGERYFQAQLYFINSNGNTSDFSQITLLRPIWGFNLAASQLLVNPSTRALSISLVPNRESFETIDMYTIKILNNNNKEVYSKTFNNNLSSFTISTTIDYYFQEGKNYTVQSNIVTKHGYSFELSVNNVKLDAITGSRIPQTEFTLKEDSSCGAIQIQMESKLDYENVNITIQRASQESDFLTWFTIVDFPLKKKLNDATFIWKDYSIEGGKLYQYRFILTLSNGTKYVNDKYYITPMFDAFFLSTAKEQLAIQYNKAITNFKWVAQENITATLGGRFPIVRRNADVRYRQFNISGTLYFNMVLNSSSALDSYNKSMGAWIKEEAQPLSFNIQNALIIDQKKHIFTTVGERAEMLFEKYFKEEATRFLTDGSVKLFRSTQEGNMIVYVSNVSFTPNKQIDNRVYDFTATITEICEYNEDNLKKYELNDSKSNYDYYVQEAFSNCVLFTPKISVDQIFNSSVIEL